MNDINEYSSIQAIKQFDNGTSFSTIAVVRKIAKKISKTGNAFFQIEVGDSVDSFAFNCFSGSESYDFFQKKPTKCPQIIKIDGIIDFYADKLSPRIKDIQEITGELYETWVDQLVEKPDESVQSLKTDLDELIAKIKTAALRSTVQQVFKDLGTGFFDSVAAVSMHHAYIHGLLEHTVHVAKVVDHVLPLYSGINEDLVIAGALLHDVGKVLEYRYDIEGIERTTIGRLQGHVVLGYRIVRSAALRQKLNPVWLERLEHIILSHQGEPEWGAAVYPATPEAVLVGLADNLDAKMAMVHKQLKKALPEQVFSDFIPGLQTCLMTEDLPNIQENLL